MSARLTNRLLKAVVSAEQQRQEQTKSTKSKKKDASKMMKKRERKKASAATVDDVTRVDPTTAHLNAILQFDQAIERYSSNGESSLKRKNKENEAESKRRKKARQADITGGGSARSSSGPNLKLETTFNKKREAKRLEAKRLADLARALKKEAKKNKKK